ncbi:YfjI family protein [Priestia megaterium]|uniref:YfjI family protein n=1 Tax=Priestia megaterium TaxID=1404 RepID=UPI00300BC3F6
MGDMLDNKKKVALWEEQPNLKILTNNIVTQKSDYLSEDVDIFAQELKKEAQTLTLQGTVSFPVSLFPKPIEQFVTDTAKALSCPPDFVAMGVLVCTSVAIGNGAVIEVKNSWVEGVSLYCGIIAEPGSAKTPAINKALKPLFELQERNFEEYESLKIQYELEKDNYEIELENWKKDVKNKKKVKVEDKPILPKSPALQQIITMDSTMEALQDSLLSNKRGILKLHDELLGFVRGMNQYRSGADRQYWLSIWSNEPIIINRKGKEPIRIQKPFVSIIGGIQPDMIEEIVKTGREGIANDGFIDRFLFCYPDPVPAKWTDDDVSEDVLKGYCEIINRIYYSLTEGNPKVIRFSNKAKDLYTLWYDETERETTEAGFPGTLKGVWKKLKGLHSRILVIMSMLKWSNSPDSVKIDLIDEESVLYTNYIMDYFKLQAKKVFQATQSNDEDKRALKIMEYVKNKGKKHEKGLCIRLNSLNQGKVFGRNTNIKMIEETISYIESQGLGELHSLTYKNNFVREFVLYQ